MDKNKSPKWPIAVIGIMMVAFIFLQVQHFFGDRKVFDAPAPQNQVASNTPNVNSLEAVPTSTMLDVSPKPEQKEDLEKKINVVVGGETLNLILADTPQRRFRGWSGVESMGEFDGMYFDFESPALHGFVMRDMNFPLDIIWLNGEKIIQIVENAQPEKGLAEKDLTIYRNQEPADGVLELPAGFVAAKRLKIGDQVDFEG